MYIMYVIASCIHWMKRLFNKFQSEINFCTYQNYFFTRIATLYYSCRVFTHFFRRLWDCHVYLGSDTSTVHLTRWTVRLCPNIVISLGSTSASIGPMCLGRVAVPLRRVDSSFCYYTSDGNFKLLSHNFWRQDVLRVCLLLAVGMCARIIRRLKKSLLQVNVCRANDEWVMFDDNYILLIEQPSSELLVLLRNTRWHCELPPTGGCVYVCDQWETSYIC